jgi:probable HAF family extracellular repeat protein
MLGSRGVPHVSAAGPSYTIIDLGALSGTAATTFGLNDTGQVVGTSFAAGAGDHAYRTEANSPINPATDDLGTLGGARSEAFGINNEGRVVGDADTGPFGNPHAFLYSGGTMTDLNTLLPAGSGWILSAAYRINNKDQMAGLGSIGGVVHAFLMTPLPQTQTQTITFASTPPIPALVGRSYTAAATGGASGNPVTFSASPAAVCAAGGVKGATIALIGPGACTVTASQAGSGIYQAATPVAQGFTVTFPPLVASLAPSSSPAGPITTGSRVTATFSLTNHTEARQLVVVQMDVTYTGSRGSLHVQLPFFVRLDPGQTVGQSYPFTITRAFPRGTYVLSVVAKDGSGDTASSGASLVVV